MDCLTSLLIHDGLIIDGYAFLWDVSPTIFKDSVRKELKSCGITIDDDTFKNLIKISMHCIKVCPSEIVVALFYSCFFFFYLTGKLYSLMITNFVLNL